MLQVYSVYSSLCVLTFDNNLVNSEEFFDGQEEIIIEEIFL